MYKIAISGKAKSGKNTAASLIASDILQLADNQHRISAFANPIKKIIEQMFPDCNKNCLYGASELRQNKIVSSVNKYAEISASYRDLSIAIGKLGRTYNPNFWVAHLALDFEKAVVDDNIKAYIISDVRFIEEFKWLKTNGFSILRIKRSSSFNISDISETGQDEISDSEFDFVLNNNGSIPDLSCELKECFNHLGIAFNEQ